MVGRILLQRPENPFFGGLILLCKKGNHLSCSRKAVSTHNHQYKTSAVQAPAPHVPGYHLAGSLDSSFRQFFVFFQQRIRIRIKIVIRCADIVEKRAVRTDGNLFPLPPQKGEQQLSVLCSMPMVFQPLCRQIT